MTNEEIIRQASFSPKVRTYIYYYGLSTLLISILGIPLILFWVAGIGQYISKRYFNSLQCYLTSKNLYFKKGTFISVEKTIPLDKIQDLTFTEGPLLRSLDLSMLQIETAGGGGDESDMTLIGIQDAAAFKEAVFDQRDQLNEKKSSPNQDGQASQDEMTEILKDIKDTLHRIEKQQQGANEKSH